MFPVHPKLIKKNCLNSNSSYSGLSANVVNRNVWSELWNYLNLPRNFPVELSSAFENWIANYSQGNVIFATLVALYHYWIILKNSMLSDLV